MADDPDLWITAKTAAAAAIGGAAAIGVWNWLKGRNNQLDENTVAIKGLHSEVTKLGAKFDKMIDQNAIAIDRQTTIMGALAKVLDSSDCSGCDQNPLR